MLKKKQPFLSSFATRCLPDGPTLLLLPPGYEKAVQTQPVSPGLPLGAISDLYSLVFFPSSSSHSDSSLFIYSWMPVLLLIILQRIWAGFVSAVLGFIYRDVLTHTSCSWLCISERWRIRDQVLWSRFDKLCVSFQYDWWTFWDVGAAFERHGGGFLHRALLTSVRASSVEAVCWWQKCIEAAYFTDMSLSKLIN